MSSSGSEDEKAQFPRRAVGATFAAYLVLAVAAGLIGGRPLFQAAMYCILAVLVVVYVGQMLLSEQAGGVVGAVWLAAFLSLFALGLIGAVAGWIPPAVCDGGC